MMADMEQRVTKKVSLAEPDLCPRCEGQDCRCPICFGLGFVPPHQLKARQEGRPPPPRPRALNP